MEIWEESGPTRNEVDYPNSSQSKSPVFLRTQADTFCLCARTCINGIRGGDRDRKDWTTFSLIPSQHYIFLMYFLLLQL